MISLIIPCFNEEESLPLFYPEATSVLRQMNCDYELIFVNDGSRDRTLEILKELSEKDPHVIYLSFSRNFGKEAAMYAGFCNAGGDYVAVMDADLQDPPSLLPEMLEKLESGELDLDESFAFYETGMKKLKHCNEEIDRVEKKMLCLNEQGELEEF